MHFIVQLPVNSLRVYFLYTWIMEGNVLRNMQKKINWVRCINTHTGCSCCLCVRIVIHQPPFAHKTVISDPMSSFSELSVWSWALGCPHPHLSHPTSRRTKRCCSSITGSLQTAFSCRDGSLRKPVSCNQKTGATREGPTRIKGIKRQLYFYQCYRSDLFTFPTDKQPDDSDTADM